MPLPHFFSVRGLLTGVWHLVAVMTLLVVPSRLTLGEPAWALEVGMAAHVLGLAAAYVGAVMVLRVRYRASRMPLSAPFTVGLLALGCVFGFLLLTRAYYARSILVTGGAAVVFFLALPAVAERVERLGSWIRWLRPSVRFSGGLRLKVLLATCVLGACAGIVTQRVVEAGHRAPTLSSETINTAHTSLSAVVYDHVVAPPRALGGGIDLLDDGYLLATGDGDLFRLAWREGTDSLSVSTVGPRIPLNVEEFTDDAGSDLTVESFRVTDLLVRREADGHRVFASHHVWKREEHCFVLRVSTATTSGVSSDGSLELSPWSPWFDTEPCLRLKHHGSGDSFAGRETGGRLATMGSDVLLTVGDHHFDGLGSHRVLPQDSSAHYGKILRISGDGAAEIVSMGHRNPQGLHVDGSGTLWSTEHGPKGGDELNRIVEGGNYGWPWETYGTAYGDIVWPLATEDVMTQDFRDPILSWVPSIGVSSLISVEHPAYPLWRGDLLVSSLKAGNLYRVRIRGGRVAYAEPMPIGKRIRDLILGPDGRIVLWTDEGSIVSLRRALPAETGEVVYQRCVGCHGELDGGEGGGPRGIGPGLDGVYGRKIGSVDGFAYSQALDSMDGRWTRQRLRDFLADPVGFAPGTAMRVPGVIDREEQDAVLRYLEESG